MNRFVKLALGFFLFGFCIFIFLSATAALADEAPKPLEDFALYCFVLYGVSSVVAALLLRRASLPWTIVGFLAYAFVTTIVQEKLYENYFNPKRAARIRAMEQ